MPRFDFACRLGHVTEDLVSRTTREIGCPRCGRQAKRTLGVPRLPGVGGAAATPKDQRALPIGAMQEAAAEVEHAWQKQEYERDGEIARPPYFQVARKKALDALAGKTAPPTGWTDPLKD